ncbi:30S ribosomal protein S6 [Poriferisphaera corsica]|uniref:Small ribosomal subunit protein bS6 n=1 Tax=Poriferisphaera corsica TaxID=2528020 RepID=A0A517YU10_9BACT|nr:30S ribosomal protein S6 [Poriferisphaera corsica]QDU33689.1 30S ribosomal protein S6 [Poriferisphaera corsica]
MSETNYLYEGLFLMGQSAGADLSGAMDHIKGLLDRASADVVAMHKWDERKLAYPIGNMKRGLYVQVIFKAEGQQLVKLERDCNLSEQVVRVMFTRGEHLGEVELKNFIESGSITAIEAELTSDDAEAAPVPVKEEVAPAKVEAAPAKEEAAE